MGFSFAICEPVHNRSGALAAIDLPLPEPNHDLKNAPGAQALGVFAPARDYADGPITSYSRPPPQDRSPQTRFCGVERSKDLDVIDVADLFGGIHVDEDDGHRSLFSLRRPQCGTFPFGLNSGTWRRFNARITPVRANIVGPPSLCDQDQRLHRGLPFGRVVLLLRQSRDVYAGIEQRRQRASAGHKNRFVERAGAGHPQRWLCGRASCRLGLARTNPSPRRSK